MTRQECKKLNLKGGYCNHLLAHFPESWDCSQCTRYPGGKNANAPKPGTKQPRWAKNKQHREQTDNRKFRAICSNGDAIVCKYKDKPCQIGKVGTHCPQKKWKSMCFEEFEQVKNQHNED